MVEDDGKMVWECPKCGDRDQNKLNVARRTCGYIGTQFWNQGRTQEIKDRVLQMCIRDRYSTFLCCCPVFVEGRAFKTE